MVPVYPPVYPVGVAMERESGRPHTPRELTLDEANALLPRVRQIIEALQARAAEAARMQTDVGARVGRAGPNGRGVNGHARQLQQSLERADALLADIRRLLGEL